MSASASEASGGGEAIRIDAGRAKALREVFRAALFDDRVPWWLKHSPDPPAGRLLHSVLARDGTRDADDKDMWMTGRAIWMFSHLYNRHQQVDPWLQAAKSGVDFMLRHANGNGPVSAIRAL